MHVIWAPDEYVTGARFLEYFQPVDGISFADSGVWDEEACAHPEGVEPQWELLRPTPEVARIVNGYAAMIGEPYNAVHVRRTDVTPLADQYGGGHTTDEEFTWFIEQYREQASVYLSCDNRETQVRLARRFETLGRRVWLPPFLITGSEVQAHDDHTRHAGMLLSVTSMWLCASAAAFLGSTYSSGTEAIEGLRRVQVRP
jgi:hypothetical protein